MTLQKNIIVNPNLGDKEISLANKFSSLAKLNEGIVNPELRKENVNQVYKRNQDYCAIVSMGKFIFAQEVILEAINTQNLQNGTAEVRFLLTGEIEIHFEKKEDMDKLCVKGLCIGDEKFSCMAEKLYKEKKKRNEIWLLNTPSWVSIEYIKAKIEEHADVQIVEREVYKNYPKIRTGRVRCTVKGDQNLNNIPGGIRFQDSERPNFIEPWTRVYFPGATKACFICAERDHASQSCPNRLPCRFCRSDEHSPKKCPKRIQCYKCAQYGHIRIECTNQREIFYTRSYQGPHYDKESTNQREVFYTRSYQDPRHEMEASSNFPTLKHTRKDQRNIGSTNQNAVVRRTKTKYLPILPWLKKHDKKKESEAKNESVDELTSLLTKGIDQETDKESENVNQVPSSPPKKTTYEIYQEKMAVFRSNHIDLNSFISLDPNGNCMADSTDTEQDNFLGHFFDSYSNGNMNSDSDIISELGTNEDSNAETNANSDDFTDSNSSLKMNISLDMDSNSYVISTPVTSRTNNEDSDDTINSNIDINPKATADLNSAPTPERYPDVKRVLNLQPMKMKEEKKTIAVPSRTMVLRSQSK